METQIEEFIPPDYIPSASESDVAMMEMDSARVTYDPQDPLPIARDLINFCYTHESDGPTITHFGGSFHTWNGTHYEESNEQPIRNKSYEFLEDKKRIERNGRSEKTLPFAPNQSRVNYVIDAMKAVTSQPNSPPCWLSPHPDLPDPREIIATKTGILHVPDGKPPADLFGPTPLWFSHYALSFGYDPAAKEPVEFRKFLKSIFQANDSIELLQEWIGYLLTNDTTLQKILLLIGPPRSGKGTISRILRALLGYHAVSGPTLASLSTEFGLAPLIGKPLAIISDARMSNKTDKSTIIERLLSVSGEDALTINRKYREPLTLKLPTRIMVCSNELPQLGDASGALASRFIILRLTKSFLGHEDVGLSDRIIANELPGIFNWALTGLQRLRQHGKFTEPETSKCVADQLRETISPIRQFVAEECEELANTRIVTGDLYKAYRHWCCGRDLKPESREVFGKDIRAAVPTIRREHPQPEKEGEVRKRYYVGIRVKPPTPPAQVAQAA